MKRLLLTLACLTFAGSLHAQTTTDAAKADGKAFGRDKAAAAQGAATTNPDAGRIPGFGGVPGQSGYFDDPDRMSRAAASQATSNTGYKAMRDSSASRPRFAPQDLDATIARSKAISNDPLSYTSGMGVGGTQGRCVPLPPGGNSSGRYMATCNVGYALESRSESCTVRLQSSVTSTPSYKYYAAQFSISHYAAPIEHFAAAIADGTCQNLGRANTCQLIREYGLTPAKDCANFPIDVLQCKAEIGGLAPYAMRITATGEFWFARENSASAATVSRDESDCVRLASDPACSGAQEVCSDSDPVTRLVDGVSVTQPCWAWTRSYSCNRTIAAQDCTAIEATPGCRLVRSDCLTDAPCKTWEKVFDCPVPGQPVSGNQFICDGDVYCIDGACETIQREANDEFKDAAVALNAMNQARREFDPDNLSLFKGTRESCGSKVFGILNCCKGKGFPLIPGIQLLMALACSSEERLLHSRDAQGLCAYVGTYCSSSFLGICITKRKVYCCFESKLSRILQEQGRQQLNKPWASPKTEQCLGFTLDEFAQLDLSKMDFSEVYAEFADAARLPDELQAATDIQQKIEDYYARARQ